MWCVTAGNSGRICTELTQVSLVKPVGITTVIHSITFFFVRAGTSVVGPSTTTSGWIDHPSGHRTGAGASAALPSGAPASTQRLIVSISRRLSERSLEYGPNCGSANHGGMRRVATAIFIARAHGRTFSKVRNDIGATCPGRWQV